MIAVPACHGDGDSDRERSTATGNANLDSDGDGGSVGDGGSAGDDGTAGLGGSNAAGHSGGGSGATGFDFDSDGGLVGCAVGPAAAGSGGGMDAGVPDASAGEEGDAGEALDSDAQVPGDLGFPDAGTPEDAAVGDAAVGPALPLNDPQIAAVLTSINSSQAKQGRLAPTRASAPAVVAYAARMVAEHTAASRRLSQLLPTIPIVRSSGPFSRSINAAADKVVSTLTPLQGSAFDTAYIGAEIGDHNASLALFDDTLLPQVRAAALKTELEARRNATQAYLEAAQALGGE